MLLISEDDLQQVITMEEVIAAVRSAFKDFSNRQIEVPTRITMNVRPPLNSCIFLPANYLSMPYYGLKQASSFPTNQAKGINTVFSDIHLYCAETGRPLAIISANHLTAMKTGAAAAVATDVLAQKGEVTLAVIGTGIQAREQVAGIQQVRPLREVRLFDRDRRRAEKFALYVDKIKNKDYRIAVLDNPDDCIAQANIVSTSTTSSTPVISGDFIGAGTHLNAIGSFTADMQEIDTLTVTKATKVVTDNLEETWAIAGDLLIPLQENVISKSKMETELGDILTGKAMGRTNGEEITIYESVGFAALDIAVAVAVYQKLKTKQFGVEIDW